MEIFKCWHLLTRGGQTVGHFISDLVFMDGIPTLVVEWLGESPDVRIPLDPMRLHPMDWEAADYMYEFPVEDPRRFD